MRFGRFTWPALGTTVVVLTAEGAHVAAAAAAVDGTLVQVDAAYSRFRPDSELRRLDTAPGRRTVISPLLGWAIAEALRAAELTGGAVDPTVGVAMRRIGYARDFGDTSSERGPIRLSAERVPGWRAIELDPATSTVRIPPGVELDLGSTGKALAADIAATAARDATDHETGVLVSLGGDIATAGPAPAHGWPVLAADRCDAADDDPDAQVIRITTGALATSSTTVRRWTRGGVALHHIVDPSTGLPAGGPWRTATVAAARCVDANAAATASIVLGAAAPEWLDRHGLDARLTDHHGGHEYIGRWPHPAATGGATAEARA